MFRIVVLCAGLALAGAVGGCVEERPPPAYPDVVYVQPGVYVLADATRPIYFVNGYYWWYDGGVWVWSDNYRGDWHRGRHAPPRLRAIHDPDAYAAHVRARGRRVRADEAPRLRPASGVERRHERRVAPPAHRPARPVPHENGHRRR